MLFRDLVDLDLENKLWTEIFESHCLWKHGRKSERTGSNILNTIIFWDFFFTYMLIFYDTTNDRGDSTVV